MNKIRLVVHNYIKYSKHHAEQFSFECINMQLEHLQQWFTGETKINWSRSNNIQLRRLINTGNIELVSREQMFSLEDTARQIPTFYLVTIPDIGGMFGTGWISWLPLDVKNFLKATGIPILLSQPGEFGFEWFDSNRDHTWISKLPTYFTSKLASEGLHNPIVIHNMSKLYMDLNSTTTKFHSVFSKQWIEHVKINTVDQSALITYDQHLANINNKKVFFCANRAPREYRCLLLLSLIKNNNLAKGYLSFLAESPANCKLSREQTRDYFVSLFNNFYFKEDQAEYELLIEQALDLLPLEFKESANARHDHVITNSDINQYRLNSFIEIVTETHDITKESINAGVLSEKTFWPILNQMPFIVVGHRSNNKLLHDLGFKTFENEFKTATTDGNPQEKVDYVNNLIQEIDAMTDQDRFDWLNSDRIKEIIMHNYNHLVNTDWNQNEINSLVYAFSDVMYNPKN